MNLLQAILIAVVEGLTEFLPVSSTGHMIIAQKLLGVDGALEFVKVFTVSIQFGAILSVIVLYWRRFLQGRDFYAKLLVAFLPAAVIGFVCERYIDRLLDNVGVVALMLVVGGALMLFVDTWFSRTDGDQAVGWRRALSIGFAQCAAMVPGVSRSMATIVGGMATGLSRQNAAEFSFFLAVPTMAAASGYKVLKLVLAPSGVSTLTDNLVVLAVGNVVAFLVAMAAIRFFIGFLTRHGFKAFGYYRIAVGLALLALLALGVNLRIA